MSNINPVHRIFGLKNSSFLASMKKSHILLLGISLFIVSDAYGSLDSNTLKSRKFGNFLNIGASLGIGEGHANFIIPSPALKIGRFNFKGLYVEYDQITSKAIQLQIDLFPINANHPTRSTFFTISGGLEDKSFRSGRPEPIAERETYSFGFGMNRYYTDKRSKISFNISSSNYSVFTKTSNCKPQLFMGLSFNYFLFKFGDFGGYGNVKLSEKPIRTKPKVTPVVKPKPIKKAKVPFLGQWFNPMVSLGLGLDRANFVAPAFGIRLGPFSGKMSVAFAITLDGNIDFYRIESNGKYDRIIGFGINYYSGYNIDAHGFTFNHTAYRKNGKRSVTIKIGMAFNYAPPLTYVARYGISGDSRMLNAGISLNYYMFRFKELKQPRKKQLFNFL